MNDINDLIQRYLDGTTSPQEERLLAEMIDSCPDATADQRALADMLRCHTTHSEDEMEQWLTEDETAVYDNIMNHRRHRNILRWAAAAVAVAVVSLSLWLGIGSKGNEEEQPMTVMETTPALKENMVKMKYLMLSVVRLFLLEERNPSQFLIVRTWKHQRQKSPHRLLKSVNQNKRKGEDQQRPQRHLQMM